MSEDRIDYLLKQHFEDLITREEQQELAKIISEPEGRRIAEAKFEQLIEQAEKPVWTGDRLDEMVKAVLNTDRGEIENNSVLIERSKGEGKFVKGDFERRFDWRRIAAAVAVIILGTGAYFMFFNKNGKHDAVVKTEVPSDVKAPETNRAMISFADGRKVYLDSVGNGELAKQGNVKLVKLANGQIVYRDETGNGPSTSPRGEMVYNTLTNPRGSKVIDMTLSDGSHVWLNAGSSIKYPVAFIGDERKVEMDGEGYFEVAHNANKPFYVSKGETSVTVLGTHFNVKAYDDENDIKVTLLEGSVKVNKGTASGVLKPGQQAIVSTDVKVLSAINVEQIMSWKNGLFYFDKADIKTIMKEVARWYDVEVVYKTEVKELFHLKTSRNTSVSNIFKILEAIGGVHLEVDGKKIIVKP